MVDKFDLSKWLAQIMSEAVDGFDPDEAKSHIPVPEQSPMANLSTLPPEEVQEWMARRHHGVWH